MLTNIDCMGWAYFTVWDICDVTILLACDNFVMTIFGTSNRRAIYGISHRKCGVIYRHIGLKFGEICRRVRRKLAREMLIYRCADIGI